MNLPASGSFAIKISSLLHENLVNVLQQKQMLAVDMSRAAWCRLCTNNCSDFKSLYDENGHRNVELYEMAANYFHPVFLTISKGKKRTMICLACWNTICDFHNFQNAIIRAQAELLDKQVEPVGAYSPSEEIAVNPNAGIEMPLPGTNHEIDDTKEGLLHLRVFEADGTGQDLNAGNGIIGSLTDDGSSVTASESITKSSLKTGDRNKKLHKTQISKPRSLQSPNEENDSTDELIDEDVSENMEFSQSDLALIDVMEFKSDAIDPLSYRANHKNISIQGEEDVILVNQKTRELQRKRLDDLIAQWGHPLQCPVCQEHIKNYSVLRAHFEKQHRHNDFYITCCQRKFKSRFHIEEHIQLHLNPIGYECDICKATFTAKGALKRHKLHQHFMPKAKKPSTSKKKQYVKNAKDLDAIIARWKTNLQCIICNALHPNFEVLRRHFHLEHPTEQCYIKCCQQKLETRWRIMEHARFHMDPKSFRCKFCNKRQPSRKLLWEHMYQDHSIAVGAKKDRPTHNYKCNACDKVFRTVNNLKAHMATHVVDDLSTAQLSQAHEASASVSLPGGESFSENHDIDSFQSYTSLIDTKELNSLPDELSTKRRTRKLNKNIDLEHSISIKGDQKTMENRIHKVSTTSDTALKPKINIKDLSLESLNNQLPQTRKNSVDVYLPGGESNNLPTITYVGTKVFSLHPEQISLAKSTREINENINKDKIAVNICPTVQSTAETRDMKVKRLNDLIAHWGHTLDCPICQESHTNYSTLREHFDKQHCQNPFFVMCCQHKLNTRFHIEEHIRLHLDPTAFKCDVCGTTFSARSSFKRHMLHQHVNSKKANRRTQRSKETTPKRKQYSKSVKELDAIIRRWKQNLQCELCHTLQPNFEVLRRHFRLEHINEKCYIICCQRKLETRLQIAEHARFHMDPKKFKCKFCDERHVSKRQLWDHMQEEHSNG